MVDNLVRFLKSRTKTTKKTTFVLTGTKDYLEPRTIHNRLKALLNAINLQGSTITIRNSFAIYAIKQGMDLKTLSEILGITLQNLIECYEQYICTDDIKKQSEMKKINWL